MNILLSIVQFNSKLQIELNWIVESTDDNEPNPVGQDRGETKNKNEDKAEIKSKNEDKIKVERS